MLLRREQTKVGHATKMEPMTQMRQIVLRHDPSRYHHLIKEREKWRQFGMILRRSGASHLQAVHFQIQFI
jgi:hypothetical protein